MIFWGDSVKIMRSKDLFGSGCVRCPVSSTGTVGKIGIFMEAAESLGRSGV